MEPELVIHPVPWKLARLAGENRWARHWLSFQANRCLAPNTLEAYSRGIEMYFAFLAKQSTAAENATRIEIGAYIHSLLSHRTQGLSNATVQQRITVVHLFYAYLVEEGVCPRNPVVSHAPGVRSLVPRHRRLPWIPTEEQWSAILAAARQESLRNRLMLAMSYDSALRREEVCRIRTDDIDPAHRLISIRADCAKGRSQRVVPYSAPTGVLYSQYLAARRELSRERGYLFLSESRRNRGRPISKWTWSKVVERISDRSDVSDFTTHTLRHLCLTDLARENWDIHEIATFAGHRNIETTLLYIHLSGRDLAAKLARSMACLHTRRIQLLAEELS
jgi:integrase/recombinase XerD